MEPIHILLVEDNEGDILLTREAFEYANVIHKLSVVRDGEEAIDFLSRRGIHSLMSEPDLLLLDVNLPKINGHEVLEFVKGNACLKHIPVIMLSTSASETDINRSYQNHANCYITKPIDVDNFQNIISQIKKFWISIAELPAKN